VPLLYKNHQKGGGGELLSMGGKEPGVFVHPQDSQQKKKGGSDRYALLRGGGTFLISTTDQGGEAGNEGRRGSSPFLWMRGEGEEKGWPGLSQSSSEGGGKGGSQVLLSRQQERGG